MPRFDFQSRAVCACLFLQKLSCVCFRNYEIGDERDLKKKNEENGKETIQIFMFVNALCQRNNRFDRRFAVVASNGPCVPHVG